MKFGKQKMAWFIPEPDNVEDLKKVYRKLAMENHPDRGGSNEAMKAINAEYSELFERLKNTHKSTRPDGPRTYQAETATKETPEDFINIVSELFKLGGLEVELCGRWLWIGGETMRNKDRLKALGCKWSKNKQKWSWHFPEDAAWQYKNKRAWSMDKIRDRFGSEHLGADGAEDRCGAYGAIAG